MGDVFALTLTALRDGREANTILVFVFVQVFDTFFSGTRSMFDDDQNVDSIFGVFDGQTTNIDDFDDHVSDEEATTTTSTAKRQRDEELEGKETLKRHRLEDVQAIVADTFEQETSREVANIAGLQNAPAAEGEQITLSHQVN